MIIENSQIIEALLFAADEPLAARKIREIIPESGTEKEIRKAIAAIADKYENSNSPLKVIELAGGYQIVTREEFASWISQLYKSRQTSRLTRKGLETLAIIAYKQPITRQEVEQVRGVGSEGVIRTLIERNLVTIKGREKAPGNPLLYGTTDYFLEYFGLNDLADLPKLKEIDELLKGDNQFLESLDQVALEQMLPQTLGLESMGSGNPPAGEPASDDDKDTDNGEEEQT